MKKSLLIFVALLFGYTLFAQNIEYAREVLNKLSGKEMNGRGYVKNGDKKAADYLASQFEKNGIKPLDSTYFQNYSFSINTFPGRMKVSIGGKKLKPGHDFVISSSASTIRGEYPLLFIPDDVDSVQKLMAFIEDKSVSSTFLVTTNPFREIYGKTVPGVLGIVVLSDKAPYFSVSEGAEVASTYWLKVLKEKVSPLDDKIKLNIENDFIQNYQTQNVIAYVEGKERPDRFIVFSAHYDHLGMMGKNTWFPGANDNASGVAMLMDLANYYSKPENQPYWSVAFMLFSGEEAGLKGSTHYTKNPLFMPEGMNLLINLDMVGTGSKGITIVNSIAYKGLYDDMVKINSENNYLPEIKARGEACNSDHCPFYNMGVKSIFIYTMGDEHLDYHTISDTNDDFPFTAYEGLFQLLTDYISTL